MPLVDFLIWVFGLFGLAYFLTETVLLSSLREKATSSTGILSHLFQRLTHCFPCLSFWLAVCTVQTYFNHEILLTKVLCCFCVYGFSFLIRIMISDDY